MWLAFSVAGGVLGGAAPGAAFGLALVGSVFTPTLPLGVPAWRQVGARRALVPHAAVGVTFLAVGALLTLPIPSGWTELGVGPPIPVPFLTWTRSGARAGVVVAF